MTDEFKRDPRYVVFKAKDLKAGLSIGDRERLYDLAYKVNCYRVRGGKEVLTCVVVESDWPEYEPTWKAIEARMTGRAIEAEVCSAQNAESERQDGLSLTDATQTHCPACEGRSNGSLVAMPVAALKALQAKVAEQSAEIGRLTKERDEYNSAWQRSGVEYRKLRDSLLSLAGEFK